MEDWSVTLKRKRSQRGRERICLEKLALEIEEQLRQWNPIGPAMHSFARRRDELDDKGQREEGGTILSANRNISKEVSEVFLNNAGSLVCVTGDQHKCPLGPTQQEVEDALTELDALGFMEPGRADPYSRGH